ncbi:polysaccharide deacetylase family protein [Deinococcus sp. Marseille-Q6407]|uniref:polysaccharide deacetylase family protein n=1 Tax=Deinococcus sp. Marseille-Q6407 TaxID=2969223 RepID=UPI0021BF4998|nr:polysaccharide deacetylase family protein [Deinococcus sp. Marseille-Q6407]
MISFSRRSRLEKAGRRARWSGLLAAWALLSAGQASAARPVILAYHQVGTSGGTTLSIQPQQLRQRVQGLRALGYRFVTASQAAQAGPQERVAVMEFDDGRQSVYAQAFPVLRELDVPGTVFVIWEQVGQPGYLTRSQLEELRAAGWETGHHTQSHAPLSRLSAAGLTQQLQPPAGVTCVAYPYNLQDARARRTARAQGLNCGVTGGPYLPRRDPLAQSAPALTPWDGAFLGARARYGVGGRTPLLAGAGLLLLLEQSPGAPALPAPLDWNPAGYELLGNGSLSLGLRGHERETRFAARWGGNDQGDWVLHLADRSSQAGRYRGFGVAYHRFPYTVGGGWDSAGPLLAGSLSLNRSGELWARWHPLAAGAGQEQERWAWGATLIPADYWQLYAAQTPGASEVGVNYWLPGGTPAAVRPWQVGAGYRHGDGQSAPFVRLGYAAGSYTFSSELDGAGRWGLRFGAAW